MHIQWTRPHRTNYMKSEDGKLCILWLQGDGEPISILDNRGQDVETFRGTRALEQSKTGATLEFYKNIEESREYHRDRL